MPLSKSELTDAVGLEYFSKPRRFGGKSKVSGLLRGNKALAYCLYRSDPDLAAVSRDHAP